MRLFILFFLTFFLFLNSEGKSNELPSMSVKNIVENPVNVIKVDFAIPERVRAVMLKNYKIKYSELFHKAIKGDAISQYRVGFAHDSGDIGYKDPYTAFKWYLKAANQEHDEAQFKVAEAYFNGLGIKKNPEEALSWYHKIAEKNHLKSLKKLRTIYSEGISEVLEKNQSLSLKWLVSAARMDDVESQIELGIVYRDGINAPRNLRKSVRWLKAAANNGSLDAQVELANLYYNGQGIMKKHSDAFKLLKKAIENKKAPSSAFYQLGILYYTGAGTKKNHSKAVELFLNAAKKGNSKAQVMLSNMYIKGEGGEKKEPEKAIMWLKKAVKKGNLEAKYKMSNIYNDGKLVPKDNKKATELLKESASYGYSPSMAKLGAFYFFEKDMKAAYMWLRLAEMYEKNRAKKRDIAVRRKQIRRKIPRREFSDVQKMVKDWKPKK